MISLFLFSKTMFLMRLKSTFKLLFIFLCLLGTWQTVSADDARPTTADLEKVTLQLKWTHQFQFAGYYAAKLKGFYQAQGLDVEIKQRDPHQNNIQQVIDGKAQYGVSDSVLLLYQARKEPIVIVAPILQHSPQVFISLKSSGIDTPYKLNGKRIQFYQKDADGLPLLAMLEELGVKPRLDRGFVKNAADSLIDGETLVRPGYLSNEPYDLLKQGYELNIFRPVNFGVDFYGDILFTHQDEATHHPDRVERFKQATIKGWQYALEHKLELAQYIHSQLGTQKTLEHLLYEADVIEEAIMAKSIPIGTLDKGRLSFIQNLFKKHGLIDKRRPIEEGIFHPQKANVHYTEAEQKWIKEHPVVKVAVDTDWAPLEFTNKDNKLTGIAAGYLNYLSRKTGIVFQPATGLDWPTAVEKMKSGELDMYSAVINTPERQTYTHYTRPYLTFPMVIATQKGEAYIDGMSRLKTKVVAVVRDYASKESMSKHYPNIELLLVDTAKKGLEAVAQGKAYAYIDTIAVISHAIATHNLTSVQISGETPFRADIAMAIRKDWPELHSIIQKNLDAMNADTKNKLAEPWLQVTYKKELEWKTMAYIFLPVSILIIIVSLYTRRLTSVNRRLSDATTQLTDSNKALEKLSETDHLTGSYNRKYTDRVITQEVARTNRYQTPLSLIIIDLDDFKRINDTYGHLVGDEILKIATRWTQLSIREADTFGRWGGEEFVLICPNTNLNEAEQLAEKVRHGVSSLSFPHQINQTISLGVAQYQAGEPVDDWLSRADKALYKAKHQGKNCVVTSMTSPSLDL